MPGNCNDCSNGTGTATEMNKLNHFDERGQAHMVDVGSKAESHRVAVASGRIHMLPATFALIQSGGAKKGDVLGIARVAAIQGDDVLAFARRYFVESNAVEGIVRGTLTERPVSLPTA